MQLLVSGGVDSTVCAALLHKALREDQVIAVHIDNGFMRKNESQRVEQSLEKLGLRLRGSVLVCCHGGHFMYPLYRKKFWPLYFLEYLVYIFGINAGNFLTS
jgi:hypothetical protein